MGIEDRSSDAVASIVSDLANGRMTRRQAMVAAAAAGVAIPGLAATVGSAGAQDAEPVHGGVLRVGLQADPAELDPHKTSLTAAWHVLEHIYEGLVAVDETLSPIPVLAESWDISEDGLTYTFNLRQGVTFHNGREFTSADVVYSFGRILDPETASPHSARLSGIANTETPDDYTVVFTLGSPDATFISKLLGTSIAVVAREVVEEHGDLLNTAAGAGTGPFVFDEFIPNTSVTLTRNENYWDAPLPYLDGLELLVNSEPTSRRTALIQGSHDFIEYAPAQDLGIFEADDSIQVFGNANTNIRYVGVNVLREPFDKIEVRKAISMVIDRAPIIDAAMFGAATATETIFPASFWAGVEHEIAPPDIEGAKALLESVGLGDGFEMTIHSWSQYPFLHNAAIVIQEQLKAINIEADTDFQENATYLANYFAGEFDISVTGTSAFVDPNDVIQNNFHSDRVNIMHGYANEEVDALIEEGMLTTDQSARAEIYARIQEILLEDLPWINLYIADQYEAAKTFVMGYVHIATGTNRSFREVWLDQ